VLLLFAGQLACEAVNFVLKRLIKEERPRHHALHHVAAHGSVGKGYGMPSSHAQFVVFWAVALGLFLMVRHRPVVVAEAKDVPAQAAAIDGQGGGEADAAVAGGENGKGGTPPSLTSVPQAYRTGGLPALTASLEAYAHSHWTLAQRGVVSLGALFVAALVAWSRVYLGYHTVRQVLAGCAAGAGCATAWFVVTYLLRETGTLAWALELPPARWLRVRDLVVEEDLCQAGWEKWEGKRRVTMARRREREGKKER
jgi:dolichyldiphosphatase